jgi:hypothetical protein
MDGLIGLTSSIVAVSLTHPIEVLKTNYQVLGNSSTPMSSIGTIKYIYTKRGFSGFFKGLPVSLTSQPVFWGMFYQTKSLNLQFSTNKISNDVINNVVCGSVGSFVANPLYVLKTRFQARTNTHTYFKMAYDMYKTEKITQFFSGYLSTALNNLKLGIQLPLYSYLKENQQLNTFNSAGIAKFISTTLFYPLDIIRTLQRNSSETLSITKSLHMIYTNNGFSGFYRGVILYNVYSTPNFIILMYATDFLLKYTK